MSKQYLNAAVLCSFLFGLSASVYAADWLTFGHDPQRSGWASEEKQLTIENVAGLELKWKAQVKNEPKSLTALTTPLIASDVTTPQGIKTLVYLGGSSNHFFALDAENGNVVWSRTFKSYVAPVKEDFWLCPQGINATPVIDKALAIVYTI